MQREIRPFMEQQGYRFLETQTKGTGVFYKYYREGFHVVLALDSSGGVITPQQHAVMENRLMDLFYHPSGRLGDFPEGFPVYHVEMLTILLGGEAESIRRICAERKNVWAYRVPEGRLVIYENQPGDFFGLRKAIESLSSGKRNKPVGRTGWTDAIKNRKNLPWATIVLAAINVIVYAVMEMTGDTEDGYFIAAHGGMYPGVITDRGQWWRLLTSMFLHFGLEHLLNNMVIFCCVASRLERVAGHLRLAAIYLLSGIGGGLLSCLMMEISGEFAVSAGASGAVFGVIGALLWTVIRHRGRMEGLTVRGMVVMLVLSLYYGFASIGVDNWSHIGGMVTGFLAAVIFRV